MQSENLVRMNLTMFFHDIWYDTFLFMKKHVCSLTRTGWSWNQSPSNIQPVTGNLILQTRLSKLTITVITFFAKTCLQINFPKKILCDMTCYKSHRCYVIKTWVCKNFLNTSFLDRVGSEFLLTTCFQTRLMNTNLPFFIGAYSILVYYSNANNYNY